MFFTFMVSYVVRARNGRDNIPLMETRRQEAQDVNKARATVDASIRREVKDLVPGSIVFDGTNEVALTDGQQRLLAYWLEDIKTAASQTATGVS